MHPTVSRIPTQVALPLLFGSAAVCVSLVSGCGWVRGSGASSSSSAPTTEPKPAAAHASASDPTVMLAKTRVTNQTGTRCRVVMAVVETPLMDASGNQALPRWWWGQPVVLTATTTEEYRLEALATDKAPVAGKRSVLVKIETLLGTRVETTAWYNIIGPMPARLELIRDGDDVAPAVPLPSTIETLAHDLWPALPDGSSSAAAPAASPN